MGDQWKQDQDGNSPPNSGYSMNDLPHTQSGPAYQQQTGYNPNQPSENQHQSIAASGGWNSHEYNGNLPGQHGGSSGYYQHHQHHMTQENDTFFVNPQQHSSGIAGNSSSHGFEMHPYQQYYMLENMMQSQQMYQAQTYGGAMYPGGVPYYTGHSYMEADNVAVPAPNPFPRKVTRLKKNKDKPKRPLSAYNIFFKHKRSQMLAEGIEKLPETDKSKSEKVISNEVASSGRNSDSEESDRPTKRRRREPHGKVSFEKMAKTIGALWKGISPQELEKYKALAAEDMKRYKKEMDAFLLKQKQGNAKAEEKPTESDSMANAKPTDSTECGDEADDTEQYKTKESAKD